MALPRELALSVQLIDEIMTSQWNMRVATQGPGPRINLTPMWFGWAGGRVYFFARGQKVVNLRRNPTCTILVDRHEKFPELQGIMLQGRARVLETVDEERADPFLDAVRIQMGHKYNGGHGQPAEPDPGPFAATARGRNRRWVVLEPEHQVSWDNTRL